MPSASSLLTALSHLPVAAVAFAVALNTVSDYKHKSWYVHYMVWIVPRMIYLHGDLWRFSTAAIESRNARLKRMGITCISWRPYQDGTGWDITVVYREFPKTSDSFAGHPGHLRCVGYDV